MQSGSDCESNIDIYLSYLTGRGQPPPTVADAPEAQETTPLRPLFSPAPRGKIEMGRRLGRCGVVGPDGLGHRRGGHGPGPLPARLQAGGDDGGPPPRRGGNRPGGPADPLGRVRRALLGVGRRSGARPRLLDGAGILGLRADALHAAALHGAPGRSDRPRSLCAAAAQLRPRRNTPHGDGRRTITSSPADPAGAWCASR